MAEERLPSLLHVSEKGLMELAEAGSREQVAELAPLVLVSISAGAQELERSAHIYNITFMSCKPRCPYQILADNFGYLISDREK